MMVDRPLFIRVIRSAAGQSRSTKRKKRCKCGWRNFPTRLKDLVDPNSYFENCHPWAPVLDESLRHTGISLRQSCPALFIAIVSVGTRFWRNGSTHPNYSDIVALQDKLIAQLLLHPRPRDATIGTVRALMLYLQWMPCDQKIERTGSAQAKTRYNDMNAWAIFGLALRYAGFINLEHIAFAPFQDSRAASVSKEDVDNMRTWLNVITYDCNLTLTSGLPVSVDPSPTIRIISEVFTHGSVQDPGDLRYCALAELACIVQRAKPSETTRRNCPPGIASIKRANLEIEDWERYDLFLLLEFCRFHANFPCVDTGSSDCVCFDKSPSEYSPTNRVFRQGLRICNIFSCHSRRQG
jgi:hypothetical protein